MATKHSLVKILGNCTVVLFALISVSACGSNSTSNAFEFFDSYLDDQFVGNKLGQNYPLDFKADYFDNKRSYSYALRFKQTNENQFYMFGIVVAKSGVLLNLKEYKAEREEFLQRISDPIEIEIKYPNIGSRAQRETGFFGPGGSSFGMVFTTTDGRYDVKLVVSLLLPEKVDSPNIDVRQAAKTISSAYDNHMLKK